MKPPPRRIRVPEGTITDAKTACSLIIGSGYIDDERMRYTTLPWVTEFWREHEPALVERGRTPASLYLRMMQRAQWLLDNDVVADEARVEAERSAQPGPLA